MDLRLRRNVRQRPITSITKTIIFHGSIFSKPCILRAFLKVWRRLFLKAFFSFYPASCFSFPPCRLFYSVYEEIGRLRTSGQAGNVPSYSLKMSSINLQNTQTHTHRYLFFSISLFPFLYNFLRFSLPLSPSLSLSLSDTHTHTHTNSLTHSPY